MEGVFETASFQPWAWADTNTIDFVAAFACYLSIKEILTHLLTVGNSTNLMKTTFFVPF